MTYGALCRHLAVNKANGWVEVTLVIPTEPQRSVPARLRAAAVAFLRAARKLNPEMRSGRGIPDPLDPPRVRVRAEDLSRAKAALNLLDHRIEAILAEPFTPRQLERLIGITADERKRWTRDGRLPIVGRRKSSRGGQTYTVPLYAVRTAGWLVASQDVLTAWREQDIAIRGEAMDEGELRRLQRHPAR